MRPAEITNPWVQSYVFSILEDRQHVTMYELEHPKYETEEDYGHILEAWLQNRDWWTRHARQERGTDEFLPKPKRRPGRPLDKQILEDKRLKEERKTQERADRARRAEERKNALLTRARRGAGRTSLNVGLPEHVLVGIMQVKGDLSIGDCIVQLLEHALGPLAQQPSSDGT